VNTGWTGGAYGTGHRMDIASTREIIRALLDGGLSGVPTREEPFFGLEVPTTCPGVDDSILDPRNTWSDKEAYDRTAADVCGMFVRNFRKFEDRCSPEIIAAGPRIGA